MAKMPFSDKYGNFAYREADSAFSRNATYVIIRKGDDVVCKSDENDEIISFPTEYEVDVAQKPTFSFTSIAYLIENGAAVKETQTYDIYDVESAKIDNLPLQWYSISDILVHKIDFDATQRVGIKNLFVRMKK